MERAHPTGKQLIGIGPRHHKGSATPAAGEAAGPFPAGRQPCGLRLAPGTARGLWQPVAGEAAGPSLPCPWPASATSSAQQPTRSRPPGLQAPPDLVATATAGTLLFDSTASDSELGLAAYRPIREAFADAVVYIRQHLASQGHDRPEDAKGQPSQAAGASGTVPAGAAASDAAAGTAAAAGAAAGTAAGADEGAAGPSGSAAAALLRVHISDPWHGLVKSGAKAVEGRLARGSFAHLRAGSLMRFWNAAQGEFTVVVARVAAYDSFAALLRAEGLARVLPVAAVASLEQGVGVYRQFYSEAEEREHGVLAVHVELL